MVVQQKQESCTKPSSSYAQLREYLSVLIENNLLEYLEGTQTYKTTEKGFNLLRMHNEIGELLQTPIRESRIQE